MTTFLHPIRGTASGFDPGTILPEGGKAATFQKTIFDHVPMALTRSGSGDTPLPHAGSAAATLPQTRNMPTIRRRRDAQEQSDVADKAISAEARPASVEGRDTRRLETPPDRIEGYKSLRSSSTEQAGLRRFYDFELMRGPRWWREPHGNNPHSPLPDSVDIMSSDLDDRGREEDATSLQLEATRILVGSLAQFAQYGLLYKTEYMPWSKSVATLVEAANQDNPQKIHDALKDMWQRDLLHEDTETPRNVRMRMYIAFLWPEMRHALARMLGVVVDTRVSDATLAWNFAKFEARHLFPPGADPVLHASIQAIPETGTSVSEAPKRTHRITDAVIGQHQHAYISRLRDALRAFIAEDPERPATIRVVAGDSRPVPESCKSDDPLTIIRNKLSHVNFSGSVVPEIRYVLDDLAQESLARDERARDLLYRDMLKANETVRSRYGYYPMVIDKELAKVDTKRLTVILHNLRVAEVASNELRIHEGHSIFFHIFKKAVEREKGVRLAAEALKLMRSALQERDKLEWLLQALNELATAHRLAPGDQSESEFYRGVFLRIGKETRADLRKGLADNARWQTRAEAVRQLIPEQLIAQKLHTRQLQVLATLL